MTTTVIPPPRPISDPASDVIRAYRSALAIWRIVAMGALSIMGFEFAYWYPRLTVAIALGLAFVSWTIGDFLHLWYGEDAEEPTRDPDLGLASIHPQPPSL